MIIKLLYGAKWYSRRVLNKVVKKSSIIKKYNGKSILTSEEGNSYIYSLVEKCLKDDCGCFIGRYGSNELDAMVKFEHYRSGELKSYQTNVMDRLCLNAGFFPKDVKLMSRYMDEMKEASRIVDVVGVWFNPFEDYILQKYAPQAVCCQLTALEPYFYETPWSRILKDKKVLVIHPFAKSIEKQYNSKREELFRNELVLPKFELCVQKAVQTIAGQSDVRFSTWFDALEYMENKALENDFDIAIVGCGAYGFPLAARLKKAGKVVIHLGGATQMLFGVKGSRWESIESFKDIINSHWIYPIEDEKPKGAEKIEGGCYW